MKRGSVPFLRDEDLLEAGVTERRGRRRHERGAARGYRNGYGKPRRLALTAGTAAVKRPRLRNLSESFERQGAAAL